MRDENGMSLAQMNLLTMFGFGLVITSFMGLLCSYIILAWNLGYSSLENLDPVPLPERWRNWVIGAILITAMRLLYSLDRMAKKGDSATPCLIGLILWAVGATNIWAYGCRRAQMTHMDAWLIPENFWVKTFLEQWAVWLATPAIIMICFSLWLLVYSPAVERLKRLKKNTLPDRYRTRPLQPSGNVVYIVQPRRAQRKKKARI